MARAPATARRWTDQGPRRYAAYVPAASVVVGSMLALLPIVSMHGWYPNAGFLLLLAWRLSRADAWPSWWAAPLGLANDLIVGTPLGFSVVLWTAAMLALDLLDRRTMWRDYWLEWALAAVFIAVQEAGELYVAGLLGAATPLRAMTAPVIIATLAYPIAAWTVSLIDRWRLRR